ncbi:MAG TPA: hypothetical protein VKG01_13930 [Thermoanaerobaculia bacterium]|nr:hypothetical protein [Thermoanaerobaculia bacterium]
MKRIALTALLAAALAAPAAGQEKGKDAGTRKVAEGSSTSITATVEAIDTQRRELTLKGPGGNLVVMEVPPEVKRFNEIKVGDHLTVQYKEAILVDLHKADSGAKLGMTEEIGGERKPGAKPAGVLTRRLNATVEVVSTDTKAPSITIKEANGNTHSFRVRDGKKLEGVNPGDKLAITYEEAVAVKVTSPEGK